MSDVLRELLAAQEQRASCALVTVAAAHGSAPREAGAKMLVYADGQSSGTIGGGKFEALVIAESLAALRERKTRLKTYPLHEGAPESFGAICGGEVTVLIEPQNVGEGIYLVGAGHCARAIAELARPCGFYVTLLDERAEELAQLGDRHTKIGQPAPEFIARHEWLPDEALVIVSRNYEIDQEALFAALQRPEIRYLGMIGSRRKVRQVFDELKSRGVTTAQLARVYAPLGLDIGADSPAQIAVSVLAEVMAVLRGRSAAHLRAGGVEIART